MSEDFDAKLQNRAARRAGLVGVRQDQQSLEFDGGSFFLQCLSNAMQERLGGFADPNESIPVETLFTKVNQRMKDLLSQTKFRAGVALSGKEAGDGAPTIRTSRCRRWR